MLKMKQLFAFLFICFFAVDAQAEYTVKTFFKFPFTQKDEKWTEYNNPQDRITALQIPEHILSLIPTQELLNNCLDFPYLADVFLFDEINVGIKSVVSKFNGFREFQKREDKIDVLIKTFSSISLENRYVKDIKGIEAGANSMKICILTSMIGCEDILVKLTSLQKNDLMRFAEENLKTMSLYPIFENSLGKAAIIELKKTISKSQSRDVYVDYFSTTRYTPKGSSVLAWKLFQNELSEDEKSYLNYYATSSYDGVTVISEATKTYNCHAYAWHLVEGGDSVWIGLTSLTDENIYWSDGSYIEVDESLATKVSYYESTDANHSAVRISNNLYRSKWGYGPVVEHAPNMCPYNASLPRKYYIKAPRLSGPTLLYDEGNYSVYSETLPLSSYTVSWSLTGSNASNFTLQTDSLSTNQCTITRKDHVEFSGSTYLLLTAQISRNDTVITTLTKGLDALYISGESNPCLTDVYHVEGLPSDYTVTWNLSGTGYSVITDFVPTNTENNNYLGVQRASSQSYANGTITATLMSGNNVVGTLTKRISSGWDFTGTWFKTSSIFPPFIPDTTPQPLNCGMTIVNTNERIVLQSDDFIGATMSCTSGNAIIFPHSNTIVLTTGSDPLTSTIIEGYKSGTCEAYKFNFRPIGEPIPLEFSINGTGHEYVFSLREKQNSERGDEHLAESKSLGQWQLAILQYETGQIVFKENVEDKSLSVNTSRWKAGVYIAVAIINGKSIAQKLAITK